MSDLSYGIVAIAARLLRADRREWGEAMLAELGEIRSRSERLDFALGCARAALFAPPGPRDIIPSASIAVLFLFGVASCLGASAYVMSTWPHAGGDISDGTVVWFAATLVVYAWFGLQPPRVFVAFPTAVRRGVTAGLVMFILTAIGRSIIDAVVPYTNDDITLGVFLVVAVGGIVLAASFQSAREDASISAGLTSAFWVGLVCSIVAFNADVLTLLAGFNLDVHIQHIRGAKGVVSPDVFMHDHIGDHLASCMNALGRIPLTTLVVGSIGAIAGHMTRPAMPGRTVAAAS